ncbi:ComEC/Rec2 family competence protein [Nocardia amamiensis]|uniref:ComEC/Rec2 family competence protein n=1 Tax=Nocardia amamiensis TaxID=404578 RepID=UPI00340CC55F
MNAGQQGEVARVTEASSAGLSDTGTTSNAGRNPVEGTGVGGDTGPFQVLDARLLPAALCCWGATIVALTAGCKAGLALSAALTVSAIGLWGLLLWAVAHRSERWRAAALVALAAVVLGAGFAAAAAWREHRVATHPLRAASGQSLRVVVTPSDDPKPLRGNAFGGSRQWVVRADLREYRRGGMTVRAGGSVVILASGQEWSELAPGRPVEFRARVDHPTRSDLTVVALHAQEPPTVAGPLPWWQRIANSVRTDFAASAMRALSPDAAGLLPALVVGDTSALSDQVRDDFEIAGLQHLTVVSGANFTILLSVVLFAVRLLTLGPRAAAAVAGIALLMFVVIVRPDPSVLRAGAMGAITLLAVLTGRRKQALPALCAAIIALLALWPGLAVNGGFALSVVATGGLILLAPSWSDWLRAKGWWRMPAEIVAVSAGAFVVTTPIMIALTGKLSLVAVLANVLVAPVIAPITVIGASGAVLSCLWSPLADLFLRCAAPPLWWLLSVARHAAALPGATVTVPGGLAGGLIAGVLVAIAVAALRARAVRRVAAAVVVGIAAVLIPVRLWHPGWPPNGWVIAACDVGQGDGLALAVGPGAAIVVDVGPDPRPIRTCLDRLRISRIPLLILTHPHADHIGGLTGALHDRTVDAIAVGIHELDGLPPLTAPARSTPGTAAGCATATPIAPAANGPGHSEVANTYAGGHPFDPATVEQSSTVESHARIADTAGRLYLEDRPGHVAGRADPGDGRAHAEPRGGDRRVGAERGLSGAEDRADDEGGWARLDAGGRHGSAADESARVRRDDRTVAERRWSAIGPDTNHATWRKQTPCSPASYGRVAVEHRSGGEDPRGPVTDLAQVATVARRAGVPLLELSAGHILTFEAIELEVLAPSENGPRPIRGAETEDANDRSVVVAARTPAGRILLTGDIEAPAQRALMRAGIPIQADILKLPHHGSRTTTKEFLESVRPRLVLVSVGADNTFGHPNPAVLAHLDALGATVGRTDQYGDIAVLGGGGRLHITSARGRPG